MPKSSGPGLDDVALTIVSAAATPTPVMLALFALGAGVLDLRRRVLR
ncbi:MAG: hypothetical protein RQ833_10345 [Sphingomonadaceae bacterium]|nr:hypothetical protein [Sphingomonadaceae bacterium]